MILIRDLNKVATGPCVATIGFFDGVHRGHQFLVEQVLRLAMERGLDALLVSFDVHPRQVMQSEYKPLLLSTLAEKCRLLEQTGVDACVLLHFTPEMAALSAYDFMREILRDRLQVRVLVIGYDHHFGRGGKDTFADYVRYGKELGIDIVHAEALEWSGVHVSSSVVRSLLLEGEVEMAAGCLKRLYTLGGKVVHGFHLGHELGFPTANIQPDDSCQLIPKTGVYAVRVTLDNGEMYAGMLNIGNRPTMDNGNKISIEVHLLHFEGDLYGRHLQMAFVKRLRDEKRFRNTGELVNQLKRDAREVSDLLLISEK